MSVIVPEPCHPLQRETRPLPDPATLGLQFGNAKDAGWIRGEAHCPAHTRAAVMREPRADPLRARPWLTRLATTLVAWLVAFLIVLVLLTLLGDELQSLPPALDALVFTGVLVPLMGNLVMPVVSVAVARWLAGPPPQTPVLRGRRRSSRGNSAVSEHSVDEERRVQDETLTPARSREM